MGNRGIEPRRGRRPAPQRRPHRHPSRRSATSSPAPSRRSTRCSTTPARPSPTRSAAPSTTTTLRATRAADRELLLSGEGALTRNICDYLRQALHLPVALGNPLQHVSENKTKFSAAGARGDVAAPRHRAWVWRSTTRSSRAMKRINLLPPEQRVKASRERGLLYAILVLVAARRRPRAVYLQQTGVGQRQAGRARSAHRPERSRPAAGRGSAAVRRAQQLRTAMTRPPRASTTRASRGPPSSRRSVS